MRSKSVLKLAFILLAAATFLAAQEKNPFDGLFLNLGNLSRLSHAQSRSISPENFTGEKGNERSEGEKRAERDFCLSPFPLENHEEQACNGPGEAAEKCCQQHGFPAHKGADHRHHLDIAASHAAEPEPGISAIRASRGVNKGAETGR